MPSLNKKKRFIKGQKVWFFALDKLDYGTVIYAYRASYIVQNTHFLGYRTWREVWETKEEAENAQKEEM